jgi:hypothetical protein
MALESASFISQLVPTNPVGATDKVDRGDDHLRMVKAVLQATFPAADHAIHLERPQVDMISAATVNIGAATTNFVRITGTTTITALDSAAAGIWRFVRFSGVLTLTYNAASLILPGAQNIITAADDCMLAISLGSGNWIVPFYQKATGKAVVTTIALADIPDALITFAKLASAVVATQSDAQAGTASNVLMTPERTTDHFAQRQASTAEVLAESAVVEFISPDRLSSSPRVAKAGGYVTIAAGVPTLQDSFGVASVVRDSEGDFTVTMSSARGNAFYAALASAGLGQNKTNSAMPHTRTTTAFQIKIRDHTNADIDPDNFSFIVFGD